MATYDSIVNFAYDLYVKKILLSIIEILGDLKLVEKPVPITIAPRDFCNIKVRSI